MKRCICLLLTAATLALAGCQTGPEAETTTAFVPLVQQPAVQQNQAQASRLYAVPWQIRTPLDGGGYSFTDDVISLFLYSQEELDVAQRVLDAYLQQSFLSAGNPMNIQQIYAIAPDFMASAERDKAAPQTGHGHYLDFDVVALCDPNRQDQLQYLVYHFSLFREYSTDPTGWQVYGSRSDPLGGPYADLTADGVSYPEAYRPLSYEELEALGDLGGRVLFATEMLYQENTTWVYIYMEETNEIVRKEIAYSNMGQYAPSQSSQ